MKTMASTKVEEEAEYPIQTLLGSAPTLEEVEH
jgi:hypothetical protein